MRILAAILLVGVSGSAGYAFGDTYGYWGLPLVLVVAAALGNVAYRVATGNRK